MFQGWFFSWQHPQNAIVLQLIHNGVPLVQFLTKVVQCGITLPNLLACEIRYAFCTHGFTIFTKDADYLSSYCYFSPSTRYLTWGSETTLDGSSGMVYGFHFSLRRFRVEISGQLQTSLWHCDVNISNAALLCQFSVGCHVQWFA